MADEGNGRSARPRGVDCAEVKRLFGTHLPGVRQSTENMTLLLVDQAYIDVLNASYFARLHMFI